MAFKPIDPKRDEFRRYLERAGVIEALSKVFVRLIKERPEDPMNYLRHNLGDAMLQADDKEYLSSELEEARAEIERLRSIIKSVNPDALIDPKESNQAASNNDTEQVGNGDLNPELNSATTTDNVEEIQTEADPQTENTLEEAFGNVNIDGNSETTSTPVILNASSDN